jgi:hypothetical protein
MEIWYRRIRIVLIALGFSKILLGIGSAVQSTDRDRIAAILKSCSEYCQKLENASLDFVCKEEIRERIFYGRGSAIPLVRRLRFFKENTYLYDYQLVRKDRRISEQRILIEENGQEQHKENAVLQTEIFEHNHVVLGPIGLLSKYWQERHDYEIIGEEELGKQKAIIIEATPRKNMISDQLFGRIWVKKEDASILKIEWNQKSMGNFKKIEELAAKLNSDPLIVSASEYMIEKNGIRFPSRYFVKESYINPSRGKLTLSETTVTYSDYKFFTVETEVMIKQE